MAQPGKNKQPKSDAPPARRGRSAPVAQDRAQIASSAFARKGFADPALVLRWSEIVGPEVAGLAVPLKFSEGANGGTLTLKAEPGASLFLQHETRALCDKINAFLGRPAVNRLRFVQGALARRPSPGQARRPGAVSPTDPADRFQGGERLREALLSLARWRGAPDN